MNSTVSEKRTATERRADHRLELEGRRQLTLSGIEDVLGFEETSVVLATSMGMLTVEGEELHIRRMSMEDGELVIDGKSISALWYLDRSTKKSGLFGKKTKK